MHIYGDILKFGLAISSIVNPVGTIPTFLGLVQAGRDGLNGAKIATTAAATTSAVLLASLFAGKTILAFFGVSIPALTVGGGLLLLLTALKMVTGGRGGPLPEGANEIAHPGRERELGISPLAFPLLAGPGAISISISATRGFDSAWHWVGAVLAILAVGLLIKLVLSFSHEIGNRLGQVGISMMTKLMGLIWLATSVDMLANGMRNLLHLYAG